MGRPRVALGRLSKDLRATLLPEGKINGYVSLRSKDENAADTSCITEFSLTFDICGGIGCGLRDLNLTENSVWR